MGEAAGSGLDAHLSADRAGPHVPTVLVAHLRKSLALAELLTCGAADRQELEAGAASH